MAFRTPDQYLESLRDGRQLFLDGDRIDDITTDPRTREAVRSAADEGYSPWTRLGGLSRCVRGSLWHRA